MTVASLDAGVGERLLDLFLGDRLVGRGLHRERAAAVLVADEQHVGRLQVGGIGERALDRADRVLDDLGLHAHTFTARSRERRDLGVIEAQRIEDVAHLGGVGVSPVGHRDLPRGAALELDAEVELRVRTTR